MMGADLLHKLLTHAEDVKNGSLGAVPFEHYIVIIYDDFRTYSMVFNRYLKNLNPNTSICVWSRSVRAPTIDR